MKTVIRRFLSLCAVSLIALPVLAEVTSFEELTEFIQSRGGAVVVQPSSGEDAGTVFYLSTPRYYIDGNVVWGDPDFVRGTRGTFPTMKSFPATSSYSCQVSSGYHAVKWELVTAGIAGSTVIQTWTNTDAITITFNYDWASCYGTALELIVYVEQVSYTLHYDEKDGEWTGLPPEDTEHKFFDIVTAPSEDSINLDGADILTTIGAALSLCTLDGWKSNTGALIKPGVDFSGDDLGITRNNQTITLYPQWKAIPAKQISFDGNGATAGSTSATSFYPNRPTTLAKNGFSRTFTVTYDAGEGTASATSQDVVYVFKGWNSQPDGKGAYTYSDQEKVTNPCGSKDKAVTLYAQWQPESMTVTLPSVTPSENFSGWFTPGGIRVGGADDTYAPAYGIKLTARWGASTTKHWTAKFSPAAETTVTVPDQSAEEGESITLPKWEGTVPLAYRSFVGWRAGTIYKTGDTFKYTPVADGEQVLFRAVWETSDLSKAVGLTGVALLTTEKTGENDDWTVDGSCAKCTTRNGAMSMRVQGPGMVRFVCSTGVGGTKLVLDVDASKEVTLVSKGDVYSCEVSGSGAHTIKWRKIGTTETRVSNVVWEPKSPKEYTITASSTSGGTASGGGKAKVGETVTLTATGDTFKHWSNGATGKTLTVKVACNETYQAVFEASEPACYYVLFDGNGAGNMTAMDGQKIVVGEATALLANKFARTSHTFKCWGTSRSGGTTYADKAQVTNLAAKNQTVTLYALWEPNGSSPTPTPGPTPVEPGVYVSRVGESVTFNLAAVYPNVKSVTGLPSGLKFSSKTGLVTGIPTKAVSKAENVKVTNKDKSVVKFTWRIEAVPTMMVGTYYGRAYIADGSVGQFQLKLTAKGKATGYFYAAGKKVSFKSTTLTCLDDTTYEVVVTYTYENEKQEDVICLTCDATTSGVKDDVDLWFASVGESDILDAIEAERDTVKECFGKVKAQTVAVLEKTDDGEYLSAKVSSAGVVKVSGKLMCDTGKLVSVSSSTHLLVAEDGEPYFYVTIYKVVSNSEPVVYDEIVE